MDVLLELVVFSVLLIRVVLLIHSPIEGLLPTAGIEFRPLLNSAPKVAGLQVHVITPGYM